MVTIFDSWSGPAGADADVVGEPTPLDRDSDGDALTSLAGPPPPLLLPPPADPIAAPCCDESGAAAAAEEVCWRAPEESVGRDRPDSSCPEGCCWTPACEGEKVAELEETEELRLKVRRVPTACAKEPFEARGGKALRDGLCDCDAGRSGACWLCTVEMGGTLRASLCCWLAEPQGNCWLIDTASVSTSADDARRVTSGPTATGDERGGGWSLKTGLAVLEVVWRFAASPRVFPIGR